MSKKISYSILAILVIAVVIFIITWRKTEKFQVVTFSGAEAYMDMSANGQDFVGNDTDSLSALPLYHKDLVCMSMEDKSNMLYYQYLKKDGIHLIFTSENFKLLLNNTIIHVDISDDPEVLEWMKSVDGSDVLSIRTMSVEDPLPSEFMKELERFAEIKPDIGFILTKKSVQMSKLLSIFNPHFYSPIITRQVIMTSKCFMRAQTSNPFS